MQNVHLHMKDAGCMLQYKHGSLLKARDRAFKYLGAAPCQGVEAEGLCPLILWNVAHNVLVNHEMQGAAPCRLSAGRGQLGDLEGLSPRGI